MDTTTDALYVQPVNGAALNSVPATYTLGLPLTPGTGIDLSSIFPSGATDVDTGDSLRGYAVTSAAANGTTNWQYSTNVGGTWIDFPAVSASNALLLDPTTLVRWEGTAGTNTALSVVAVDNTLPDAFGSMVDTSSNGGSTAFSDEVATLAANASVTPPVLLDLNQDGAIAYSQITADMNGDGVADLSSWVAADDGLLFWDKHGDGSLTDRHQFAFAEFGGGTDLTGMALAFDSNHDGKFDIHDSQFDEFKVWQDLDQDATPDMDELITLMEAGIASINLVSDWKESNPVPGVSVYGETSAMMVNGDQMLVLDASFDFYSTSPLTATV